MNPDHQLNDDDRARLALKSPVGFARLSDGPVPTPSIERYDITETGGFLPAKDPLWSFEKEADSKLKDLKFALDYIFARVADPSRTGGTPFMKWSSQLGHEATHDRVYPRWNS